MNLNKKFQLLFLGAVCLSQALSAQEYSSQGNSFNSFAHETFEDYIHEPIKISTTQGNGIGYSTGYSTAETFLPLPLNMDWVPFIDARTHYFNNGKFASNLGLGARYVDTHVWGANVFYDRRRSFKNTFNQAGLGLECLGPVWDFRINGYLPMGRQHKIRLEGTGPDTQRAFIGREAFAMKGGNAEVGSVVYEICDFSLYAAIGPYYFQGFDRHIFGGKSRLSLSCWDYITLNVIGSYDHVFKEVVQGRVDFKIPLFAFKQCAQPAEEYTCAEAALLKKKAAHRVERFEIIVLDKKNSAGL